MIDGRRVGGASRWRPLDLDLGLPVGEVVVGVAARGYQEQTTTLFEDLQERHPGEYGNGKKRTFQRRVKAWKALHGADKDVMFRQMQEPGRQGLSDFTELKGLVVTIAGEELDHRLYHFRLAYSGWSHVKVVLGGESYSALAEGLQEALWRLGGAPLEPRTDSLSAAYKNLSSDAQADLTERYTQLCAHYSVPARLVGERLRLHIFDDRIEAFVGATLALRLPRVYSVNHERARRIDYRHLIGVLARKPQAFRYSQLREDLLPNATYRAIWQYLDSHLEARAACKRIVGILAPAARADCEQALGAYLLERIAAGSVPTLTALESRFDARDAATQQAELRDRPSIQHALASYDHLLPAQGQSMELH